MNKIYAEKFSSDKYIVPNAEIFLHSGKEALMDTSMYRYLRNCFGEDFMGYIAGVHYVFKPESTLPAGKAAVPEVNHDDPDELLIQR